MSMSLLAGVTVSLALVVVGWVPLASARPSKAPSAASTALPDTAWTCSGAVCITVVGSGRTVTSWATTGGLTTTMCTYAEYLANGSIAHEGTIKCGTKGRRLSDNWPGTKIYAAGTVLCNEWYGLPGRACITVE
jgi:hypothetical protein